MKSAFLALASRRDYFFASSSAFFAAVNASFADFRSSLDFFKAAFAALPALIALAVVLWGIGEILQRYFPWLVKMRILIQFPG